MNKRQFKKKYKKEIRIQSVDCIGGGMSFYNKAKSCDLLIKAAKYGVLQND